MQINKYAALSRFMQPHDNPQPNDLTVPGNFARILVTACWARETVELTVAYCIGLLPYAA